MRGALGGLLLLGLAVFLAYLWASGALAPLLERARALLLNPAAAAAPAGGPPKRPDVLMGGLRRRELEDEAG